MQVTIHGPNLNDQSKGTFHVHTAACRDNAKEERYNGSQYPFTVEVESVIEVVTAMYSDQMDEHEPNSPWSKPDAYVSDFHFAPCTKDLPYSVDTDN